MTYYILGDVWHQDDSGSAIQLLGTAETETELSKKIISFRKGGYMMPDAINIFVVKGEKYENIK